MSVELVQCALIDRARLHESILAPLLQQCGRRAPSALLHDAEQQRPQGRRREPLVQGDASRVVEVVAKPIARVGSHGASMIAPRPAFENGAASEAFTQFVTLLP